MVRTNIMALKIKKSCRMCYGLATQRWCNTENSLIKSGPEPPPPQDPEAIN